MSDREIEAMLDQFRKVALISIAAVTDDCGRIYRATTESDS